MKTRLNRLTGTVAAVALSVAAAGCGSANVQTQAPPTLTTPAAGAKPIGDSETGTLLDNIRNIDLRTTLLADPLVSQQVKATIRACSACGIADPIYAQLTGGSDDVLVPIESGGTAGVIAFYVYGVIGRQLRDLLAFGHGTGLTVNVRRSDDAIIVRTPQWADGAPQCCATSELTVTYRWKRNRFVVTGRRDRKLRS